MTDGWTQILSGGVAGSILTLFGQQIVAWWTAPRLAIDFHETYPGCRVRTPANVGGPQIEQHYIRVKIRNHGWSTAKNVSVAVTGVGLKSGDFDEEVLDLQTSISAKPVFDIGRQGYRFVDLFHLVSRSGGIEAKFDFVNTPVRFQRITAEPHEFTARIFVSADNAASFCREVVWQWDGSFEGLKIDGNRWPRSW